jgi:hypothetical protein
MEHLVQLALREKGPPRDDICEIVTDDLVDLSRILPIGSAEESENAPPRADRAGDNDFERRAQGVGSKQSDSIKQNVYALVSLNEPKRAEEGASGTGRLVRR